MRLAPIDPQPTLKVMLTPHRLVRWVYVGRLSLASAIFIAAVFVWNRDGTDQEALLIASLAFAVSFVVTAASVWYGETQRHPLRPAFYYLQSVLDLVLVTAAVHVTGGSTSQFAALYILVIAAASLILPAGGGLLIAALGNVLYIADAVGKGAGPLSASVWLQLIIFALVALGSAYVGAQLHQAGAGKEALEAELVRVRLEASEILHNIRSGILTIDARGTLLYANPTAAALLDLDLDTQLGRPVLLLLERAAPELASALVDSATNRTRTTRGEGTISARGRRFPIGVATTYADGHGPRRERTATAIFQDISDQKRIETLRLRAERLEGVAALSASLAHEIKNPLASIRSAVEQLSRMPKASEDERTLSALVLRESDRLSRLLSEFLDFARVRVTRTGRVDVGEVARGAAALAGAHPDCADGVAVRCVVRTPHGPLLVDGDEDLLHRAIFNLALNAVQASPPGHDVVVEAMSADEALLAAGMERGAVAVCVRDHGPGVPAELRHQLFDPFFTTKPGGSGLGLAVVQRAVEAHRGYVLLDAGSDGTSFTIVLPIAGTLPGGLTPERVDAIVA